jgi:hypothetical protein
LLTKTQATRRVSAVMLRAFLVDALRACGLCEADGATAAGAMVAQVDDVAKSLGTLPLGART